MEYLLSCCWEIGFLLEFVIFGGVILRDKVLFDVNGVMIFLDLFCCVDVIVIFFFGGMKVKGLIGVDFLF